MTNELREQETAYTPDQKADLYEAMRPSYAHLTDEDFGKIFAVAWARYQLNHLN